MFVMESPAVVGDDKNVGVGWFKKGTNLGYMMLDLFDFVEVFFPSLAVSFMTWVVILGCKVTFLLV